MREGRLTYGAETVRLRLADTEAPYRPLRRAVWPQRSDIPGAAEGQQAGDVLIRRWSMSEWGQGETGALWREKGYHRSSNVRPDREGDRLILGAHRTVVQTPVPADFTSARKFGRAHGGLWAADTGSLEAHRWNPADTTFPTTGWAIGGADSAVTSITDFGDGSNILVALANKQVRKVSAAANSSLLSAAVSDHASELRRFQGAVYQLDGAALYEVDTSTINTRTVRSDPGTPVGSYMASVGNIFRRLCVIDTGVAWLVPGEDGSVDIMEYNAKIDTDFTSGRLPVEGVFPYSTLFAHGFIFVGFRDAAEHGEEGDARIYFQRGAQRGTTPPIRLPSGSTASQPVILAGTLGRLLVFYYGGAVWVYDLAEGAVFMLADTAAGIPSAVQDAATFGKDVFVANIGNTRRASRLDSTLFSEDATSWESGRFDFNFPGVNKALYRVTVVTDPLPAANTVTLEVSADGAAFQAVTGTHQTADATSFTWDVSSSTAQTTGFDFELKLGLSGGSADTPRIREVYAEAGPAQKRRAFEVDVDLSGGQTVKAADPTRLLSRLLAAAEYDGGIIKFTDPWGVASNQAAVERDVLVEVLAGGRKGTVATLRMWEIGVV